MGSGFEVWVFPVGVAHSKRPKSSVCESRLVYKAKVDLVRQDTNRQRPTGDAEARRVSLRERSDAPWLMKKSTNLVSTDVKQKESRMPSEGLNVVDGRQTVA